MPDTVRVPAKIPEPDVELANCAHMYARAAESTTTAIAPLRIPAMMMPDKTVEALAGVIIVPICPNIAGVIVVVCVREIVIPVAVYVPE